MLICMNQKEIERAVLEYVKTQGVAVAGQEVAVNLTTTGGGKKNPREFVAHVAIRPATAGKPESKQANPAVTVNGEKAAAKPDFS